MDIANFTWAENSNGRLVHIDNVPIEERVAEKEKFRGTLTSENAD